MNKYTDEFVATLTAERDYAKQFWIAAEKDLDEALSLFDESAANFKELYEIVQIYAEAYCQNRSRANKAEKECEELRRSLEYHTASETIYREAASDNWEYACQLRCELDALRAGNR